MDRIAAVVSTVCFVLSQVAGAAFVAGPAAALATSDVGLADGASGTPGMGAPRYRFTRDEGAASRDAGCTRFRMRPAPALPHAA